MHMHVRTCIHFVCKCAYGCKNMPVFVLLCMQTLVFVHIGVCLCASGSLQRPSGRGFIKHFINVKHNLLHQIKQAPSYTYSHTVSDRDPNSVRKTCVTCSQQEDEIKATLCKFTVSHMSTQRIHNDRLIFTQTHRTHIFYDK